jgi:hypothetical protein
VLLVVVVGDSVPLGGSIPLTPVSVPQVMLSRPRVKGGISPRA